ncbi:hypothetical protein OG594_45815 [Streptomyces sp. NBC_01214]|uniref:hypothetical protein n=1 Tax=Streptomyces sp. NBC_01214 TaxID=2903777 RepID=UPI002256036F|nr:hypothetical protein [Streptomyces sp. NBC_01214]MCX4808787.1 hypothetical protein [Streptomyces sp. NBC_01214]
MDEELVLDSKAGNSRWFAHWTTHWKSRQNAPAEVCVALGGNGGLRQGHVEERVMGALRIAAAALVADLQVGHSRLDKPARHGRAVRAAFGLSHQLLPDGQARLFRPLPLNPGFDLSTEAASHLSDASPDQVEAVLQRLAGAHLIELGTVWGRVVTHGYTHAMADQRDMALSRLVAHYRNTVQAAHARLQRPGWPSKRTGASGWLRPPNHSDVLVCSRAPTKEISSANPPLR